MGVNFMDKLLEEHKQRYGISQSENESVKNVL